MTAQPAPPRAGRREWLGVAALMLPCMLVVMDLSVLFLAVPSLSADLRPSSTELLWITDVYGFLIAGALIVMGTLGDRIGRRRVLVWGAAAFGGASLLAAASSSAELLILARGLQGLAGATLIPSTMALLFAMFPHDGDRRKAIGLISLGFTGGAALGPIVGGVLLAVSGWHAVFLINVPAMVAVLLVVPRLVPEFRNPDGPRVDLRSAVLLVAAVLSATYAVKRFAHGDGSGVELCLLLAGLAIGAAFMRRQRRLAEPLLPLALFRAPAFRAALSAQVLTTFVMFGTFFFVAQYFQVVLGLAPLPAALWGLPGVSAMALCTTWLVPRLAGRHDPGALMAGGAGVMAVGLLAVSQLPADASPAWGALALLVVQVGVAPLMTLAMELILGSAPPEQTGAASGTAQTCNELGGALGIALLGSLGTAVMGVKTGATAGGGAFTNGMEVVALLCAVIMLGVATVLALRLRRPAIAVAEPRPA